MKSYGVIIQRKHLQQYFHEILFFLQVVQTSDSVDETRRCDHSNETFSAVLSHGTICFLAKFGIVKC